MGGWVYKLEGGLDMVQEHRYLYQEAERDGQKATFRTPVLAEAFLV